MGRKSAISTLPAHVRQWLERALTDSGFSGFVALEEALREQGYSISKSAIHRYGQKIEKRYSAIKAATEAARLLTEGAPDDHDARSEAVIALVQTELLESIIKLQDAEEQTDPSKRIALLSTAAKNIATLARASVNQKRFRLEVQERVRAAAQAVEKIATRGGLSAESVDTMRREILGIAA